MRVIEVISPGGPEQLRIAQRPRPEPAAGEVLIRVAFAGVNGADLVQRQGHYPAPEGASDLLGLEVSGEIVQLGAGVRGHRVGDLVCALIPGGGYADYCLAHAGQVLKLPRNIEPSYGAAIIETAATVWYNLFHMGRLTIGEKLLVHGGTSGVGTTAVQMARLAGAEVYCTAGSAEKVLACRTLGASRAINYRTESFSDIIREETAEGVDVILDIVGAPYLEGNLKCLRRGGRLVFISYKGGRHADLDIARVMLKELTLTGSTLRSKSAHERAEIVEQVHRHVWPPLTDSRFMPILDKVFLAEDAAAAHHYMESSDHIGKIVLDFR